jgi:hypothetical protein
MPRPERRPQKRDRSTPLSFIPRPFSHHRIDYPEQNKKQQQSIEILQFFPFVALINIL